MTGKPVTEIDEGLRQFATAKQLLQLDAMKEHGSQVAASLALGLSSSALSSTIYVLKQRAALAGYVPELGLTNAIPSPLKLKGASIYNKATAETPAHWLKTSVDEERRAEMIREWYETLAQEFKGLAPIVPVPESCRSDLLSVYCVGDPHFGLYAWAEECGEDFDVDKAREYTQAAIDYLVDAAPPSKEALLIEIGDLLHADDSRNVTPASGHVLDVDTRHFKVVGVALEAMRNAILRLLEKHEIVRVWIVAGNHDPHSSIGVLYGLDGYFHDDPRVIIEKSPSAFRYYKFGQVLIGATHGDTVKSDKLPAIMATDRAKWWGDTEHRVWWTGHIHHLTQKEYPGVTVESMRTMAAKDAWHHSHGYRSRRDMQVVVYDCEFGEASRFHADSTMFRKKFG